jgi:uncharacterized phage-like protein YoqJ
MVEEKNQRDVIAVTGHRPEKLGGYSFDVTDGLKNLAKKYLKKRNPREVITGMALGWDQAVALACIPLKIPFTVALPFEGQENQWSAEQRKNYRMILTHAAQITIVGAKGYAAFKFQARNEWMADNCTRVMALWDGSPGGTANMIRYATGPGRWRPLDNLWSEYINASG